MGANAATAMSNAEMNAGSDMANASQQGILGQGMAMANRDAQMGNIIGGGMSNMGSLLTTFAGLKGGGGGGSPGAVGASTGAYDNTRLNASYPSVPHQ